MIFRILVALIISACSTLPDSIEPLPEQFALPAATTGTLADIGASIIHTHEPAESGFHLLENNADALNWRLALIDEAVSSLDLMYYLWHADDSGRLLLKRVIQAADRGVSVRLLIDDLLLTNDDRVLMALDQHPNIQFRIFNPWKNRKVGRVVEFVASMDRLNSRMHNKLLIADTQATIWGGRNIGDNYFGLSDSYNFHDLDVLGFGPVASEASNTFDHFWNSSWTISASVLPEDVDERFVARKELQSLRKLQTSDSLEGFPLEPGDWSEEFGELVQKLHFGSSRFIYDTIENGQLVGGLTEPLGSILSTADREILLVNAYIIPDQDFIDELRRLVNRGVHVRILTNSLASHDVPAVNSHYQKWRKPILETGAELYELRPDAAIKKGVDTPPVRSEFIGLHIKAFVVDRHRIFIGSMNFDPRSVNINSEMGVTIDSATLGAELARRTNWYMEPENAWQVRLTNEGKLIWIDSEKTLTRQPARSIWQRFMNGFFRLLPESQF
ncbi:MAG: phospholipase D family protein [Pseudomonadales bacterium]